MARGPERSGVGGERGTAASGCVWGGPQLSKVVKAQVPPWPAALRSPAAHGPPRGAMCHHYARWHRQLFFFFFAVRGGYRCHTREQGPAQLAAAVAAAGAERQAPAPGEPQASRTPTGPGLRDRSPEAGAGIRARRSRPGLGDPALCGSPHCHHHHPDTAPGVHRELELTRGRRGAAPPPLPHRAQPALALDPEPPV